MLVSFPSLEPKCRQITLRLPRLMDVDINQQYIYIYIYIQDCKARSASPSNLGSGTQCISICLCRLAPLRREALFLRHTEFHPRPASVSGTSTVLLKYVLHTCRCFRTCTHLQKCGRYLDIIPTAFVLCWRSQQRHMLDAVMATTVHGSINGSAA